MFSCCIKWQGSSICKQDLAYVNAEFVLYWKVSVKVALRYKFVDELEKYIELTELSMLGCHTGPLFSVTSLLIAKWIIVVKFVKFTTFNTLPSQ